jgi:hypothetical protein
MEDAKQHSSMNKAFVSVLVFISIVHFAMPVVSEAQDGSQSPASTYQPKFPGDPAHSDSEAAALGYLRVAMRAQHLFNKQYGHYATSLPELVHTGTFTRRMISPQQGDYVVSFKGKKDAFAISISPNSIDANHRSFYGNEDGKIHADNDKAADDKSPVISKAFRESTSR